MRIFSCIVLVVAATAAGAQDMSASTCNSAAGNPPACNQANVRGDRSEGWLAQGRDDSRPVNGFYRAGSDHRKDGEAIGW